MIFWVSSFCAAWTPCCASHASSALTAWSWRPLMPPAVLMSATASSPAFRIAMPGSAYGPVKGPVIPTLIGPALLALLLLLPQAAINSAPQAARLAATNRRLNIVPPYPFVVAHRHLPVRRGESAPAASHYSLELGPVSVPRIRVSRSERARLWAWPRGTGERRVVMTSEPEPRLRVVWTDPVTGRKGYAVIDRMVNGLAGGGTRMRSGVTIEEVERLARTMSYKNGAFNLPGGGAKGGIDIDPHDPEARGLLSRYVRAMRPLYRNGWGTAEDLGISQELLNEVFAEQGVGMTVQAMLDRSGDPEAAGRRGSQGLAVNVEGIGLADCIGGYGVAEASAAAAEYKGWDISKLRAVVQGFGSMGGSSARYLARLGARIVGVVDVNGAVTNPDGLDVELLLRSRTTLGEIDRSALRPGDLELPRERWLEIDADIVMPAAVADAITAENSAAIKARMVVEAANIPTTDDAQRLLHQRGVVVIPDYVANGGANAWWWWTLLGVIEADAEQSFAHVSKVMRETVRRMLELADARRMTPRDAANELSMENLDRLAGRLGEDASETPLEPVRA